MAVDRKLTGWIELVSATQLTRLNEIVGFMHKLAEDDKSLETARLESSDSELAHADFTCWDNPAPNFAALFKPLVDLLEKEEYLYFEEKVRFGQRGRTLRAVLVSGVGVFKAEQDAMILLLQERDSEMDDEDDLDAADMDDTDHGIDMDEVWDIETEKYHNFFANGILVHNRQDMDDDPAEDLDREHNPEPDVPDCER